MANSHEHWFTRHAPRTQPRVRLFCFPYAGGNGQLYRSWTGVLPPSIEVVAAEYPGRGRRFGEPLIDRIPMLVERLLAAIRPLLDRPFAFYGHSNGALVAYELARQMRHVLLREPRALLLAAKRSPLLPAEPPVHQLDDAEFTRVLHRYDGTPPSVLESSQLMEVYLPVLRADFALGETYHLGPTTPLTMPCHLISGGRDRIAAADDVRAWAPLFSGPVHHHTVDGGHFFLNSHTHHVARIAEHACLALH
jgi:medium-chain acyl-[acyl-carrier-protein] hydrolase